MGHPLFDPSTIEETPDAFLRAIGDVFAVFDARSQDSGNISYGVRIGDERYFVKTAGLPDDPAPFLAHPLRVDLLRNAVRLSRVCNHAALVRLFSNEPADSEGA